ncbi:MAG: sel1 repeat family protein [Bacteroidales bacterium]|nr:sel1 repeat family protein [Bacteroidales bacterium]
MKTLIYFLIGAVISLSALERKAEEGDPEALYRLATLYESGYDSILPDTARSISLLRRAAELDYAPAQNYLGFLYGRGELMPANKDSARYWIGRAADLGDLKAANNLGFMLLEEYNDSTDSLAAMYLSRAAEGGLPVAISTLGSLYAEGRGVPRDTLKAVELFEKAIETGFKDAQLRLLNLKGKEWMSLPPESRYQTALRYMRLGSPLIAVQLLSGLDDLSYLNPTQKEATSETEHLDREQLASVFALLGQAFSHGAGVGYDHAKANKYFATAALLGNPAAAFVFAETLEIFPDILSTSLFNDEERSQLESLGADFSVTARELRDFAKEQGITDARQARDALIGQSADIGQ